MNPLRCLVVPVPLLLLVVLSGCLSGPLPGAPAPADYGLPIERAEAVRLATAWAHAEFDDPQIEWEAFGKAFMWTGRYYGPNHGYALSGAVDGRNGLGFYTGAEPVVVFFRDGALISGRRGASGDVWGFANEAPTAAASR